MTAAHLLRSEAINPADHIGLACEIAMRYTPDRPIEDSEAFGDALVGLMKAIEHFRPEMGFKFSTYAWRVIKQHILDGYRKQHRSKRATRPKLVDPVYLDACRDERDHLEPIDTADLIATMQENISRLPPHYQRVVRSRLEGNTLQEIGSEIGLTKERIRQIEISATSMLRQLMAQAGAIG